MLDGTKLTALVVGGGGVALRKVRSLLDGGVRVSVVATDVHRELRELAMGEPRLTIITGAYTDAHIGDALIVIAATNDVAVNTRVAEDAILLHRLVNVVDAPSAGSFATPAVHRSGELTIAVSAGRLPAAAGAIRDAIGARFDDRYASAIAELRDLRDRLLANGGRDEWKTISGQMLGDSFCADVESGLLPSKVDAWR